jgi:hypothetical protein
MTFIAKQVLLTCMTCMTCGNQFMGPEPVMCCSGIECGCMGLPSEPVVCSKECYDNLPARRQANDIAIKNNLSQQIQQLEKENADLKAGSMVLLNMHKATLPVMVTVLTKAGLTAGADKAKELLEIVNSFQPSPEPDTSILTRALEIVVRDTDELPYLRKIAADALNLWNSKL